MTMKFAPIFICIIMTCWYSVPTVYGHGYVFSQTNEEMKDQITIYLQANAMKICYDSEYLGQIAPHIRNMIDKNADLTLTQEEINFFFNEYQQSLNQVLLKLPLTIASHQVPIQLHEIQSPWLLSDSLLAPFNIKMTFVVPQLTIKPGAQELVIDPRLLFSNGNHFIALAKELVNFTDDQERAIGRFLTVKIYADDPIRFTSTFPGYIKNDKKSVHIFGVFYDDTVLRINQSQYPKLKIKFTTS